MQRGTPVLPKSVTPSRIEENLKGCQVNLDGDDMAKINEIKTRARYVDQRWSLPIHGNIEELWDAEFLL